jgi:hypothetical protein
MVSIKNPPSVLWDEISVAKPNKKNQQLAYQNYFR